MHLDSHAILRELEAPYDNGFTVKLRLRNEASISELKNALQLSQSSDVRRVLIEILGDRHAKSALSLLLPYLNDQAPDIRSETADALAKIKSPAAGSSLLRQYEQETNRGTRTMIAAALGAVGHTPAIPTLVEALKSPDRSLRGSAAWSLGALEAEEAQDALQQALSLETETYPKERLIEAMEKIKGKVASSMRTVIP